MGNVASATEISAEAVSGLGQGQQVVFDKAQAFDLRGRQARSLDEITRQIHEGMRSQGMLKYSIYIKSSWTGISRSDAMKICRAERSSCFKVAKERQVEERIENRNRRRPRPSPTRSESPNPNNRRNRIRNRNRRRGKRQAEDEPAEDIDQEEDNEVVLNVEPDLRTASEMRRDCRSDFLGCRHHVRDEFRRIDWSIDHGRPLSLTNHGWNNKLQATKNVDE